jgi:membrane-bound ClpP family serine protease
LILRYEEEFKCRLAVVVDGIFGDSITYLEELIFDANPTENLHLMLSSPGGDGETALRLVRSAQARCKELTVIVPDQAKSAATIVAIGAHWIVMGPMSDLGPVDPQFPIKDEWVAAKDIIAAVESAEKAITLNPDSYPLHAALLADVTAVMVQQARSALGRTEDLVEEALLSNPSRTSKDVANLKERLMEPLIKRPKEHGAMFGSAACREAGLPVVEADPSGSQWQQIWNLWAHYFKLGQSIYEGRKASVMPPRST